MQTINFNPGFFTKSFQFFLINYWLYINKYSVINTQFQLNKLQLITLLLNIFYSKVWRFYVGPKNSQNISVMIFD